MSAMTVILLCFAVLAVLVLICAVCLWWDRNGENKSYDERQLMEQGRARAVADTVEAVYFGLLNLVAGTAFFFLALIHLIALLRKEQE